MRRTIPAFLVTVVLVVLSAVPPAGAAGGALDPGFDGDGMVTTDFGSADGADAVDLQRRKIVAVGYTNSGVSRFALARYNRNGSLDPTFDGDGRVVTDFTPGAQDSAIDLAVKGKKIIAVGVTGDGGLGADFAVARYRQDGSLDTRFDGDGMVTTDFGGGDIAYAVGIQPDGKIVVAGFRTYGSGATEDWAIARYNGNGSLDTNFDGDGKLTMHLGAGDFERIEDLAFQPDGKIVVAGVSQYEFAVARFNANGSLDPSFDGDGYLLTDFGCYDSEARRVAIQPDGKIVAAGSAAKCPNGWTFGLARYNSDGSLDTSFDVDGKVTTDFGTFGSTVNGLALQPNGWIVAAGYTWDTGDVYNFALARYGPNGSLDTSFDVDGKVTTDFGPDSIAWDVVLQSERIVAAGIAGTDFALARYLGS